MLNGPPLLFPSLVTQRKSKCFSHQVLVHDRIQVRLFVVLILGHVEVLDHGRVLHEHANHARVDNHDDRVLAGVERPALCNCELV